MRSRALADGRNRGRHTILIALSLALAGWAVYINSLTNPFVYDDYRLIVENTALAHPANLWGVVWHDVTRPVVNLSYAFDAALWGLRPVGFHLTNVLLHAINVLLVFVMAGAVERDARARSEAAAAPLGTTMPDAPSRAPAIVAAALFAVHPMLSQAVGYVSARADLLSATFVLTAFLSSRRFLLTGGAGWGAAALGAWLVSLGCKEVAVMLPFALLVYHRLVLPPRGETRRGVLLYGPMLGLVLVAAGVRVWLLRQVEYQNGAVDWPLALVAIDAIGRYLRLLAWPSGQTVFHALTAIDSLFDLHAVVAIGVVVAVAAAAWWLRRIDRGVPFGLAWFGLFLLPSSALFVLGRGEALAEHRVYLPSVGVFLAAAALVGALLRRSRVDAPALRWIVLALTTVVVLQLGVRTMIRNAIWSSPVALWQESVDRAPDHWLPRMMLAEALRVQRGCTAAIPEYQRSIRLRPQEPFSYTKLGGCFIDRQQLDEAAAVFEALVRVAPQSADGPTGLAIVAMLRNHPDTSREHLLDAVRRDPSAVLARQLLARLDEQSNPARALQWCQEIQRLAPNTADVQECIERNQRRLAGDSSPATSRDPH